MTVTELYLERIALRMEVIAAQVSCPLDIMEHVAGVCYIAPFLSTVDELLKVWNCLFLRWPFSYEMLLWENLERILFQSAQNANVSLQKYLTACLEPLLRV